MCIFLDCELRILATELAGAICMLKGGTAGRTVDNCRRVCYRVLAAFRLNYIAYCIMNQDITMHSSVNLS